MRSITVILLIGVTILVNACSGSSCNELPDSFTSYTEAKKEIRNSKHPVSEKVNTTGSSWIQSLEYYSCDSKTGYLIMTTRKGDSYLHQNVPVEIWGNFKNAPFYGRFYNSYLKNRYNFNFG